MAFSQHLHITLARERGGASQRTSVTPLPIERASYSVIRRMLAAARASGLVLLASQLFAGLVFIGRLFVDVSGVEHRE